MKAGCLLLAGALLCLSIKARAVAQGSSTDTILGRVFTADGTPIPLARVRVGDAAGREIRARADADGRYLLVVQRGAETYALAVEALGYAPLHARVAPAARGGRVVRDVRLNVAPLALEPIFVRAGPRRTTREETPGETVEELGALTTELFPLEPGDVLAIAALTPGAQRTGAGEDGGLSLNGQPPDQTQTTLDGVSHGATRLPAEALRSVYTVSHAFDVSLGRFSGGQLALTTMSGTNRWGVGGALRVDDPALRYGTPPGRGGLPDERQVVASVGGGGPLVRDRLFVYGAADVSRTSGDAATLFAMDPASLRELGVSPDSARKFSEIVEGFGLSTRAPGTERHVLGSTLLRLDFQPSPTHALTARFDGRASSLSSPGATPLRFPVGRSDRTSADGAAYLRLVSAWERWANDLRVSYSQSDRRTRTAGGVPSAHVQVSSSIDGELIRSGLSFGSWPTLAPDLARSLVEIANDLSRPLGEGSHVLKVGALLQTEEATQEPLSDLGRFTFPGLAALAEGRPTAFRRSLGGERSRVHRLHAALYVGDTWMRDDRLSMVFGVRAEATQYARRGLVAPAVGALLGGTADSEVPSELLLSPRVGFSYVWPGRRGITLRGGLGVFAGSAALAGIASVWDETGSVDSGAELVCIGAEAPAPDWTAYEAQPGAIPTACLGTGAQANGARPAVTLFAPGFRSPRTWRAALGLSGSLARRISFDANASLTRGLGLPTSVDRNLDTTRGFALIEEAGRPVHVPVTEIDTASGEIQPGASRIEPSLGVVRELGSEGESWTRQVTARVTGLVGRNTLVALSYAYGSSRVRAGPVHVPGGGASSVGADARRLEWGPSDYDRRHSLQVIVTDRLSTTLQVSAIAQTASGTPFTPLVSGDVNGDGSANDRAFVFEPGPEGLGAEMADLVAAAPGRVRACLGRQIGRVAERGSCRGPWWTSVDLQLDYAPRKYVDTRRLAFTVTAQNVTAGLDHLLHGRDGRRGWGQFPVVDPHLLELQGFDPARRAYRYAVNPRFGHMLEGVAYQRSFGLVLQARVTLGADPRFQHMADRIEATAPLHGFAAIRRDLAERIRNVPRALLAVDSADPGELGLTSAQVERLRAAAAELEPRVQEALDGLAVALGERGPMSAARRSRIEDFARAAHAAQREGVDLIRAVLTAEQLAILPAWLVANTAVDELRSPPAVRTWTNGS